MKYLVTDTNIFLDMLGIGALTMLFELDMNIGTTDFVVQEIIKADQAKELQHFIDNGNLSVFAFSAEELQQILTLKTKRNLRRIADKSVLWKALQLKCRLLTGDKNLRKEAEEQGLEVNGSLWVISTMTASGKVETPQALAMLEKLKQINSSLPAAEIDKLMNRLG